MTARARGISRLFKSIALAAAFLTSFALAADAQETARVHRLGGDVFASGRDVRIAEEPSDTVFAAGNNIVVDAETRRSVHAAGRRVQINRPVDENLYAAGFNVDINSSVKGDIVAAGYRVTLAPIASAGRDLIATGRFVNVNGPVAGNAVLTAGRVEIDAPITGWVEIRSRNIAFGPNARIDGTLAYTSNRQIAIPASVIDPSRVTANVTATGAAYGLLIAGIIVLFGILMSLAAIFAFVFRSGLPRTRAVMLERPWRSLVLGIIATSAFFGSVLVLAVLIVGIPLIPLVVILTPFAIFAGYLTSAHALGATLIARARRTPGSGWADLLAIVLGLIALGIIGIIPILGWVVAVLAVVAGIGAWFGLILTPRPLEPRITYPEDIGPIAA
jgi:cytoskeletal protein CcmA (bactofilin family)